MTFLTVLSFAVALAVGVWLGLPRRYDQPLDEINKRLEEGGEHQKVKRHRTVFSLLQAKVERGSHRRRRRSGRPFHMG
jgi:hypothetical protein